MIDTQNPAKGIATEAKAIGGFDGLDLLVFDNYDSFTYNLVHLIESITGIAPTVARNDAIDLEAIGRFDAIVLSPGPGIPSEAGLLLPLIERYGPSKKILGVCLGHQAIGQTYGASLSNLAHVYHGIATPIVHGSAAGLAESKLFEGLASPLTVGRYHSWVVDRSGLPDSLSITALDEAGHIMGLRHAQYDVEGIQFHPESVLTPEGPAFIANWLKR